MNKLLLLFFSLTSSQLISINICSDFDCKANCKSWIATNDKCMDTSPPSITTYTSYAVYSDSNCNTIQTNTYKTPITLDGHCNLLYLSENTYPYGSYKADNLSLILILSLIFGCIFIIISIICCIKCCKRPILLHPPPPPPPNTAIILDTNSTYYPPVSYGYPVYDNRPIKPSAPPAPPGNNNFI